MDKNAPNTGPLHKYLYQGGMDQTKARSPELHLNVTGTQVLES